MVKLPVLPPGGDLADYVDRHDSTDSDDLRRSIEQLASEAPTLIPGQNSIRAPIEKSDARIEFALPVPASELGEDFEVAWVWFGYLARQHVTLFTGLWKAGKSTLLAHLAKSAGAGGEIAGTIEESRLLIVSEESRGLCVRRCSDLKIGDHVEFDVQPFLARPSLDVWTAYIQHLAALVTSRCYDAVIFDTFASVSPVRDENDAAGMTEALMPLRYLTSAGAGVLIIHHPRKGDAGEGQASRGSGALPGFVDVILELRRFQASSRDDRRRVLTAFSRFEETPRE